MKRIEILKVPTTRIKLTVTADRITIKFPVDMEPSSERQSIEKFLLGVADETPADLKFTARGRYQNKTDRGGKLHRGIQLSSSDMHMIWTKWFTHTD